LGRGGGGGRGLKIAVVILVGVGGRMEWPWVSILLIRAGVVGLVKIEAGAGEVSVME
jgi:hypothetical protein